MIRSTTSSFVRARLAAIGFDQDLVMESVQGGPPSPGPGQVVVAIEASGVCYRDLVDRWGRFPFLNLPVTPGHEGAGRVVAVGEGGTRWKVGDRVATMHRDSCGACIMCRVGETSLCQEAAFVLGLLADGSYSPYLTIPESALYAIPEAMPAEHAAVLHCTYGTAWRGLVRGAGLKPGEKVVITGANGGVGAAAVHLARRLGAQVVAVVRRPGHEEFLREMGAHEVVVDPGGVFHQEERSSGADVALECVGAPTFNASLRCLRVGGRLSVVGNVDGERVSLNLGYIIIRAITLSGPGGATATDMAKLVEMDQLAPLRVPIEAIFPLSQADAAQRRLLAGGVRGRLILKPDVEA